MTFWYIEELVVEGVNVLAKAAVHRVGVARRPIVLKAPANFGPKTNGETGNVKNWDDFGVPFGQFLFYLKIQDLFACSSRWGCRSNDHFGNRRTYRNLWIRNLDMLFFVNLEPKLVLKGQHKLVLPPHFEVLLGHWQPVLSQASPVRVYWSMSKRSIGAFT